MANPVTAPSITAKNAALANVVTPEEAAAELEIGSLNVQLKSLPAGHPAISIANARISKLLSNKTDTR